MKYKLIYILLFAVFFSCTKEESNYFEVDMTALELDFEPVAGGAFLTYKLPANTGIYALQAKYKDYTGKDMLIKGTYTNNKIKLPGFNEAQTAVPVEISLLDKEDNQSKAINKTFATLPSAAVSVFEVIEVKSGWNGFRISYPGLGKNTEGVLNIYTLGINPKTQKLDTLLLDTAPLQATDYSYNFTGAADTAQTCLVVLRTDDYRGNVAHRKVYEKLPVVRAQQIAQDKLSLYSGSCWEDDVENGDKRLTMSGEKYLFDGDKIGWQSLKYSKSGDAKNYAFLSIEEDECVTPTSTNNVWTFDLSASEEIASVRIYSALYAKTPGQGAGYFAMKDNLKWRLPNTLEIYGTDDPNADVSACDLLGKYSEYQSLPDEQKWIYPAIYNKYSYSAADLDLFMKLDPNYLELAFEVTGKKYQYVKIKVLELFEYDIVSKHYVPSQLYMEELEVYKKKDE